MFRMLTWPDTSNWLFTRSAP